MHAVQTPRRLDVGSVVCVACGLGARPVAELRRGKSMGKSMQEGGRGHAK